MNQKTSYITLNANPGKEDRLAEFLKQGADVVKTTEPGTQIWTALQSADAKTCVIYDTFVDEVAQKAHFDGLVAKALYDQSSTLIQGGWETGVIPNINNGTVLSSVVTEKSALANLAIFIPLTAKPGKGAALANLLKIGAQIVADTEPLTLYWFGLQFSETEFGIIDFFATEAGIQAHFEGEVAGALQGQADALVEGGWDDGVVSRVTPLNVLAFMQQPVSSAQAV